MPINELRSIATFARTAELGSLRRAAAAQGMTPQAASQALAQLEQHLGVRLFHRTTRSMSLTDEGRQFLEASLPALTGMQHALAMTRRAKDGVAGPLRIVGPRSTFVPVLWPLLDEFCSLYPDVQPDVELDDRIGNWVEDRVDVGFRIGRSAAEGVIARRLFPLQLIICASPAYLRRCGAPDNLQELTAHRCSVFRSPGTGKVGAWRVKVEGDVVEQHVVPALCVNDEAMETEAVLAGHTLGLLTGIAAAGHIRAGRLIPLLTDYMADLSSVFVYYGSRPAQPARVRAFIDLAVSRLTDNPAYMLTAKELASAEVKGRRVHKKGAG
ncbi:MAG: LysR family transcriptional regulator [Pseudomonadota bacterium]